jgi:hypothetical protein
MTNDTTDSGQARRKPWAWLLLAMAIVVWMIQPVTTGVGDMTRLEIAHVYLHLALIEQPHGFSPLDSACLQAYLNEALEGMTRLALLPSYGVALGRISSYVLIDKDAPTFEEVLRAVRDAYQKQIAEMFPGGVTSSQGDRCHLPKPSAWTQIILP